jgi:hypothetical protein
MVIKPFVAAKVNAVIRLVVESKVKESISSNLPSHVLLSKPPGFFIASQNGDKFLVNDPQNVIISKF